MKNSPKNVSLSLKAQDSFICGCMTFGGVTFIMAAIIFLSQNNAAQALVNAVQ